jgi:hypothetical protein
VGRIAGLLPSELLAAAGRLAGEAVAAIWRAAAMPVSSLEKFNRRAVGAAERGRSISLISPRVGDETGPRDGCRRAGDFRFVFIGDFERGNDGRVTIFLRSVKTCVGSGIVLSPMSISCSVDCVTSSLRPLGVLLVLRTTTGSGLAGEEKTSSKFSSPNSSRTPESGTVKPVFLRDSQPMICLIQFCILTFL